MYFFWRHETSIDKPGHIFRLTYRKQNIINYTKTEIHNKRLSFLGQKTFFRFPIINKVTSGTLSRLYKININIIIIKEFN